MMASTIGTGPRESRRRRIADRGADRLAFITGQIQGLPAERLNSPDPLPQFSDQITVSPNEKDKAPDSTLLNHEVTVAGGVGGSVVEPASGEFGTDVKASIASSSDISSKLESSLAASAEQNSTRSISGTKQQLEQLRTQKSRLVTPNQISSAIAATERPRLFGSLIIALLVVLSYFGFPLLSSNIIRSAICLGPLYLVLLTNLTLVLAQLLFNNERGIERAVEAKNKIPPTGEQDWTEHAASALEICLFMKNVIDAVFMICSVYAVIVIFGLSLVH